MLLSVCLGMWVTLSPSPYVYTHVCLLSSPLKAIKEFPKAREAPKLVTAWSPLVAFVMTSWN